MMLHGQKLPAHSTWKGFHGRGHGEAEDRQRLAADGRQATVEPPLRVGARGRFLRLERRHLVLALFLQRLHLRGERVFLAGKLLLGGVDLRLQLLRLLPRLLGLRRRDAREPLGFEVLELFLRAFDVALDL